MKVFLHLPASLQHCAHGRETFRDVPISQILRYAQNAHDSVDPHLDRLHVRGSNLGCVFVLLSTYSVLLD